MAITAAHALLYSSEPEALRKALREVFGWKHVDAGEGWLIFALPPAEIAVHPVADDDVASKGRHQMCLMCDDVQETMRDLRGKGVEIRGEPKDAGWGIFVMLGLPGGVEVMLYQPRHASPLNPPARP